MEGEDEPRMMASPVNTSPQIQDVTGTAKNFLDDIILNIEQEGVYKKMGVEPNKTYGLFGVPGTGKTLAVQALNNHMNADAYAKYLISDEKDMTAADHDLCTFEYSIGRFGSAYINKGSMILQKFFDTAGIMASYGKKVLVVMDECDAILGDRNANLQSHAEDRKVLETIMKNVQLLHDTPNMYLVMMSNMPEACDGAAVRAGRIDKKYRFELPTDKERHKAYQMAISDANKKAKYKVVRAENIDDIVDLSKGFSYADIMQSVYSSVRQRATEVASSKSKGTMPAAYVSHKKLLTGVKSHAESFVKKKENTRIGF